MKATPIAAFFAIAFCTQTVSIGMAATIASPRDIALEHEAETANGAGVLLPDPELNVVLGPFSVEMDTDGAEWPREFLDALQNTGFDAEAGGWRISTSVDQNTGATVFFDAEGRSEIPDDIRPAKILPDDFRSYIGKATGLPVFCLDQEEKVCYAS